MMLLSVTTNPEAQTLTLDLLGKRSVNLSPSDARDVIAILSLSLTELESSGREETFGGPAVGCK